MPYKKRMHVGKRGGLLDAFLRIVLSVILLFVVFKIGMAAAKTFFGENSTDSSIKKLAGALNQPGEGGTAVRVGLEENSAIIGFSSAAAEMRCYFCPDGLSEKPSYFFMVRPPTTECKGTACVCSCQTITAGQPVERDNEVGTIISCRTITCKPLSGNIPDRTSLRSSYPSETQWANYPFWKGGFFVTNNKDIRNGIPRNKVTAEPFSVSIQRSKSGTGMLVNVCPPPADPAKPMDCIQQN